MQKPPATAGPRRYALFIRREGRTSPITASDADLFAMIHWSCELKARGKIVAGAVIDPTAGSDLAEGFVILSVDDVDEADEIVRTWPIRDGVRLELAPIVGNF